MPRPKLKSDDEVLEAATAVLKRCGPINFTLSEVANEVGLSRAALIQRFTNRDTLLVRMMERSVGQVRVHLDAMPAGAGPEGLWGFLQVLVRSMNTRYDFSVNFLISWYELQVPELRKLSIERSRAVVDGIRKRLPPGTPAGAELLLHSIIAGATTQWATDPHGELADHVLAQIAAALRLMFPGHQGFRGSPACGFRPMAITENGGWRSPKTEHDDRRNRSDRSPKTGMAIAENGDGDRLSRAVRPDRDLR